ncbi:sensor histidine kinase [Ramlibacter sp. MAHUQ-53]|uniref:sensor histidine kinase n=1 Tax=unclassified Ramlibacter TaxID=2617605 RepID=UPI00363D8F8B
MAAIPADGSLRRALLRWLLGPLLLVLVVDTGVGWWASQRAADLAHDRSLHDVARELALHVQQAAGQPRLVLSPAAEQILMVDPEDRLAFKVSAEGGTYLGGEAALAAPARLPGAQPVYYRDQLHGTPVRVIAAWLPAGEGASTRVLVQVAETLHQRNALAREILAHALVPQVVLIILATVVIWFGVHHGLEPLMRLRDMLARRDHRDLQPLPVDGVPAEVRPLVLEVNALMQRLGGTLDSQSRFIADAAHQLKTPVSGLKAQIELALRESDPQRLHHGLAQLYVGVERMSRLVGQLLALARNEPGAAESLRMVPLDLAALALDVGMEWVPQALRREIDLGFEGPPQPAMIHADAERLRELLNNLVDNAVRYSHEGGRVTVRVALPGEDMARLSVSDDGPRIPPGERTRIFERFHRLLGAPADGSGLGLAIVSEIATLHGARITLEEDVDGVGNTFSVWFPLLPGPPATAPL